MKTHLALVPSVQASSLVHDHDINRAFLVVKRPRLMAPRETPDRGESRVDGEKSP